MKILVVIGLLLFAIFLLSVGVIFRADHRFHSEDIAQSKAMRERNIHCAKAFDKEAADQAKKKLNLKNL